MKINMADENFNIGMVIACTTCHDRKIQGEVVAYDLPSKILAIRSPGSNGKPNNHDVTLVNLNFIGDLTVIREASEPPPPLTTLNHAKLTARLRQNKDEKLKQVNYVGVGVSPQAQKLCHAITKTITEVYWDGLIIIVLGNVKIFPPYGVDNCKAPEGTAALGHVKKIVEKFHRDQSQDSPAACPTPP